jgi:hypothetical protein
MAGGASCEDNALALYPLHLGFLLACVFFSAARFATSTTARPA